MLVIAPDGFIGYITDERSPKHIQNDPFYDKYVFIRDMDCLNTIVMYTTDKYLQPYSTQKETVPKLTDKSCLKQSTVEKISKQNHITTFRQYKRKRATPYQLLNGGYRG